VSDLPWLDPTRLSFVAAAEALAAAVRDGVDPETDPPRSSTPTAGGEILLMPAAGRRFAGVKAVTVAPGNPAVGLPRIHGVYLLFDAITLAPVALVDGAGLTFVRTPAVSLAAIARLTPDRPLETVVFGTGPQAWAHTRAVSELRPGSRLTVVGRTGVQSDQLADRCQAAGLPAKAGTAEAVAGADLIICATTARRPLFDGATPPDSACVVAVGSHELDAREVDEAYVARAALYVESRAAAGREAGELVGVVPGRLTNLAELAQAEVALDRPRLFKSVGMAWEDLVIAETLFAAL